MRPFLRPLLAAALGFAILSQAMSTGPVWAQAALDLGEPAELVVETGTGIYPFMVELADDAAERARGFMFRREIPPDTGMLFDMEVVRPVGFWMKNTYVSLDIIFIGEDGRVVGVAERTTPESEAVIDSGAPVRYVLELVAGTARKIGLKPGDLVRHPAIPSDGAPDPTRPAPKPD
jgi:uncharacterized membrane protein (UPF0127 family)